MSTRLAWVLGLCLPVGCVSESKQREIVTGRATFDMACSREKLELTQITGTSYGVRGCGKQATYVLTGECGSGQPCGAILNGQVQEVR
jgi:hypothetical protein